MLQQAPKGKGVDTSRQHSNQINNAQIFHAVPVLGRENRAAWPELLAQLHVPGKGGGQQSRGPVRGHLLRHRCPGIPWGSVQSKNSDLGGSKLKYHLSAR